MNRNIVFIAAILLVARFNSFAQPGKIISAKHTVSITFHNKAGDADLHLDSSCTNPFGEIFIVKQFKYYISNIRLRDDDTKKTESFPGKYFLIDQADSSSKIILLSTSLKHIISIEFMLGVDSLKNVSGIQTGSLDPAKGMFWTWNTGYVMAKLEGTSAAANTPQHSFSWHVGGYKKGEATARMIYLKLPVISNQAPGIRYQQPGSGTININADILKWFNALHEIKIAGQPFCHQPGALAVSLADNYSAMFTVSYNHE